MDDLESEDIAKLKSVLEAITQKDNPRRIAEQDAFCYDDDDAKIKTDVAGLKEKMQNLKVVARAKVTQDRIYSAAYHPEVKKDLIFFGGKLFCFSTSDFKLSPLNLDKHGQLGIWDARAPVDEITDEDGEPIPQDERERGKYWQLQPHWPANSKSAISNVKFNPTDSHSVSTYPVSPYSNQAQQIDRCTRVLTTVPSEAHRLHPAFPPKSLLRTLRR